MNHPDAEGLVKDPGPVIHQRLKDERSFRVTSLELPAVGIEAEVVLDGGVNFPRKREASLAAAFDREDDEPPTVSPFDRRLAEGAEFRDPKAQTQKRQQDGVITSALDAVTVGTSKQPDGFLRRQRPPGHVFGECRWRDEFGECGIESDVGSGMKILVKGPDDGELQVDGGWFLFAPDEIVAPARDHLRRDQPRVGPGEGKELLEDPGIGPPCVFGERPSGEIGNRQGGVAGGQRLECWQREDHSLPFRNE